MMVVILDKDLQKELKEIKLKRESKTREDKEDGNDKDKLRRPKRLA